MKRLLLLILALLTLAGCVAVPVHDRGYGTYYRSYPYSYWGPEVSVFFVPGFHFHGHHGGHGHRGGHR